MNTVRHLLEVKGNDIWEIQPNDTVFEALRLMAEKDIGALLVMEKGQLIGILTERDYARKIILKGKASISTPVHEIMDTTFFPIHPDQTMEECMDFMTNHRVRYFPVVETNGEILGVISIGDVVKNIIHRQREVIKQFDGTTRGN